ncbi:MAG: hypothetical protein HPY55_10440 [Firmicutes bacterium]|nr:hypothetical protein [Bacillota bacterium]
MWVSLSTPAGSSIDVVTADDIAQKGVEPALGPVLEAVASRVGGVYLHVDIDVVSWSKATNDFPTVRGGVSLDDLEEAIAVVARCTRIRAAALSGFNPELDEQGEVLAPGGTLVLCRMVAEENT